MTRETFRFSIDVIAVATDKDTAKRNLEYYLKHKNQDGIEVNDTVFQFVLNSARIATRTGL